MRSTYLAHADSERAFQRRESGVEFTVLELGLLFPEWREADDYIRNDAVRLLHPNCTRFFDFEQAVRVWQLNACDMTMRVQNGRLELCLFADNK